MDIAPVAPIPNPPDVRPYASLPEATRAVVAGTIAELLSLSAPQVSLSLSVSSRDLTARLTQIGFDRSALTDTLVLAVARRGLLTSSVRSSIIRLVEQLLDEPTPVPRPDVASIVVEQLDRGKDSTVLTEAIDTLASHLGMEPDELRNMISLSEWQDVPAGQVASALPSTNELKARIAAALFNASVHPDQAGVLASRLVARLEEVFARRGLPLLSSDLAPTAHTSSDPEIEQVIVSAGAAVLVAGGDLPARQPSIPLALLLLPSRLAAVVLEVLRLSGLNASDVLDDVLDGRSLAWSVQMRGGDVSSVVQALSEAIRSLPLPAPMSQAQLLARMEAVVNAHDLTGWVWLSELHDAMQPTFYPGPQGGGVLSTTPDWLVEMFAALQALRSGSPTAYRRASGRVRGWCPRLCTSECFDWLSDDESGPNCSRYRALR